MHPKVKILAVIISLVVSGCSTSSEDRRIEYQLNTESFSTDSILFKRDGGGGKAFTINDTDGYYRIWVKKWEYRDTLFAIRMFKNFGDSLSEHAIPGLFSGRLNISGVIHENEAPTGTWAYLYVKRNGEWVRVANPTIINSMIRFETEFSNYLTGE